MYAQERQDCRDWYVCMYVRVYVCMLKRDKIVVIGRGTWIHVECALLAVCMHVDVYVYAQVRAYLQDNIT